MTLQTLRQATDFGIRDRYPSAQLTERELYCITHALSGLNSKEISSLLDISAATVRSYLARGYKKLAVNNLSQLKSELSICSIQKDQFKSLLAQFAAKKLSSLERCVLLYIAQGLTGFQISHLLNYSIGSINKARYIGYKKLGIHSKGELLSLLSQTCNSDSNC